MCIRDRPSGALRALQENGNIFAGSLIGCVPYTKAAIEQLASCKIEKNDNIGESNISPPTPHTPILLDNSPSTHNINIDDGSSTIANSRLPKEASLLTSSENDEGKPSALSTTDKESSTTNGNTLSFSNNPRRLHIKDGKSLFVHNTTTNNNGLYQHLESTMRQKENMDKQNKNKNGSILHLSLIHI